MAIFKKLNVAIIEESIKSLDKTENLSILEKNLQLIPKGIDLVVLPELFSTGNIISGNNDSISIAEKNTDETILHLKRLAKEHNIAIAGSFIARTSIKIYNRAFFIENSGEEYFYDKKHFDSNITQNTFSEGNKLPPIIRFRGWNIMLGISDDLRYPVWLRNAKNKYDLLIIVANWGKPKNYEWNHLLVARAIENQCYVCGANALIDDNGDLLNNSKFLDYNGRIIAEITDSKIIYATLENDKLEDFRKERMGSYNFDEFILK